MEENINPTAAEMKAERGARKNQELYGDHVRKIGGCAVVTVDDEVIAVELPFTYPQLVTAIIKRKFSADQAEAITANFILSKDETVVSTEKAAEYAAEYRAYQDWRNKAKAIAKEVMGMNA